MRAFVAVADCGTVSRAAERLHVAQPALSRQIIALEQDLRIRLFDRVGRRLRLTGEGQRLLASCRDLFGQVTSLDEQVRELRGGDSGVLNVAASPHMIDNIFSTFLHVYAKRHPRIQVKLVEAIGAEVFTLLNRGDVHLGTVVQEAVSSFGAFHFGSHLLMPITFSAVYNEPFSLGRRQIEVVDVAKYPLLVLKPSFAVRKTFDAACRLARVRQNVRFESGSPHTLLALAEAAHGIAIVPSNVLIQRYRLKTLPITHQNERLCEPLAIFWDKRRLLPSYAEDFCALLAKYLRGIIPPARQAGGERATRRSG